MICLDARTGSLLAIAAAVLTAAACGGPPTARSGADERLPPEALGSGPSAAALSTKPITREEWNRMPAERLKPACDARAGAGKPDVTNLQAAGKIVASWMDFMKKPKTGPKTDDGKRLGGGTEPTRTVSSIGMTCSATKNSLEVNGVQYPFDMAWVVSGQGSGPAISGGEGGGYFAMFEVISFKEQKIVFAKVYVPGDANDDTDDTIVASSLAGYLPANPDEPVVRATGDRRSPVFETLVFAKDTTSGFGYLVPKQVPLGRARYVAVGKFEVAK